MTENNSISSRPRVLSGMRPTGRLHLGNYMGALYNWVQLQDQYDCFFFIADLHALTTDYADPSTLRQNIRDVALDFLSAGLDPERSACWGTWDWMKMVERSGSRPAERKSRATSRMFWRRVEGSA